jgi:RpiR family carbohydrate utilization transcriptional regulator
MLRDIELNLSELRPAERLVAEYVLGNVDAVIHGTLATIASASGVSEPTVLRFCRSAGFKNFGEFKIKLIRSAAVSDNQPPVEKPVRIGRDDTVASSTDKVFAASISALIDAGKQIPRSEIERAALAILRAHRVIIFGLGTSAIIAADAQHKLFRLGVAAANYSDPHLQAMSAATLGPDDVLLAISQTGEPRDLFETTSVAVESGVTVIALTRSDSPLAGLAQILISIDLNEPIEMWNPIVSRLAHLVTVDALVVAVALLAPPSSARTLERMQNALRDRRIQKPDARARRTSPSSRSKA